MKSSLAMSHLTLHRTPLALGVAAVLSGAPVGAQVGAPGPDAAPQIEEIVVTATRREQSVLDVPYNISAISGETLASAQITDAADLMRNVTGVGVVDRGYRNSGVINGVMIRGVNTDGAALGDYALSAVPTVSTYVNDTPVYANFLLKDLERVEVLRGPQGTLYGSGSLGGTVRYVTRAPKLGELEGSVAATASQVEGSSGAGWSGDGMINLPLGETLALRVNGTVMDLPGLTDYVNVYVLDENGLPVAPNGVLADDAQYTRKRDADTVDIKYGRASLLWKPTDGFDATLSHTYQEDEIGGRRQQTVGVDGFGRSYRDYENGAIQLEPSAREIGVSALEVNVDFGFATLTSSSSWYDHEGDSVSENTGFYAQAGFLTFYYNYPRPMASAVRTYSDRGFVQELRLASKTGNALDYVVGLYYQDQKLGSTQQSFLYGFKRWWDAAFPGFEDVVTGDMDFDYSRRETFEDRAAFGELTWHLTDDLQITGGVRRFENDFTNDTFMALPAYAGFAPPTNASFDSSDSDTLFKVNASWRFAGRNTLYGTISEGYRRGGSNAVPLTGTFAEDPAWQRYEKDSVVNYEIGVKGASPKLQYSAALFYVDWDDVQVNTATPNWGFFAAQNGGNARSAGLEVDLSGALTDRLGYSVGYAYIDAELRADIARPDDPDAIIALAGARLPGTPEHALSVSADYAVPLGAAEWITRVNGYYQSSTMNAISRSTVLNAELDSFQLWGLSTTYSTLRWDATLFVKNLLNEEGVTGLFTEAYMGTAPAEGYFGNGSKQFLSLPRTLGFTVNYRF